MIYNAAIEHIRSALNQATISAAHEDESDIANGDDRLTQAAVLIALTQQDDPRVILTQRPTWLRAHAGQVAFPGGKVDASDRDIQHTALREAHEELSIEPHHVDIIATCPEYRTGSGYRITPIVAVVPDTLNIIPNPDEVESWFAAPSSFLFNNNNASKKSAIWNGQNRSYYDIHWQDYRIWGVTAGIIANITRQIENYHNDK